MAPRPLKRAARVSFVAAAGAAVLLCVSSTALPAHPSTQFRSRVEAVRVDVLVRNDRGEFQTGLGASDFELFDNGRRQPLTGFTSEQPPLCLAFVLDKSSSMLPFGSGPQLALEQFIAAMPASDYIAVGSLTVPGVLNKDRATLSRQLAALPQIETSRVWMGIIWAAEALAGVECRRAVIVATDGRDTQQALARAFKLPHTEQTARTVLRDRMAQLYVIAPRGEITREIWRVSEESGGRALPLVGSDQLSTVWSEITSELRHQYLLSYTPPESDGREHDIKVAVRKKGFTVRSRRTYLSPAAK
jgi:VWFA-related protein